jgi:hypothetical protein
MYRRELVNLSSDTPDTIFQDIIVNLSSDTPDTIFQDINRKVDDPNGVIRSRK